MRSDPVEKFYCAFCGEETISRVRSTRGVRRHRICVQCGTTFRTREVIDDDARAEPMHHPRPPNLPLPF